MRARSIAIVCLALAINCADDPKHAARPPTAADPSDGGRDGSVPAHTPHTPDASAMDAGKDAGTDGGPLHAQDASAIDAALSDAMAPDAGDAGEEDDASDSAVDVDVEIEWKLCEPAANPATTWGNACPELPLAPIKTTQITMPGLGMQRNVFVTYAPGDPEKRLFLVDQRWGVYIILEGGQTSRGFYEDYVLMTGPEQGLLGLVFDPDYSTNRRFFLAHADAVDQGRVIVESCLASENDPDVVDYNSRQILIDFEDPEPAHNGGMLAFGPDGYLYFSSGDGGGARDQHTTHGPDGNAQSLTTGFGKILRIDPEGNEAPCIWAYGLRNPWRFSFHRETGDLYVGDVGQDRWKEVDIAPRDHNRQNYGWRFMEGNHCTDDLDTDPLPTECDGHDVSDFTPPVYDYSHDQGRSVIGGYVYRGSKIPSLRGYYVFADWASGKIWAFVWNGTGLCAPPIELTEQLPRSFLITSFGEDEDGELYIVTSDGDGTTGALYRIDPAE